MTYTDPDNNDGDHGRSRHLENAPLVLWPGYRVPGLDTSTLALGLSDTMQTSLTRLLSPIRSLTFITIINR